MEAKNMNTKKNQNFDLEDRTAKFGEDVIDLCKKVESNAINCSLINQIIRSVTSIGANYCEADGACSKRDFRNKICICKKEAKETKHWLRMIVIANSYLTDDCRKLWLEAQELTLIFSAIINTLDKNNTKSKLII